MLEVLHVFSCSSIGSCRFSMKIDSFEPSLRGDDDCFHAHCVTRTRSNAVVQQLWVQKTRHVFSCSSIDSRRFTLKIEPFELPWCGDEDRFHAHCVTRSGSNTVVQKLRQRVLYYLITQQPRGAEASNFYESSITI